MTALPTGTVTFLFTDIEGSTKRWEANPQAMSAALQRHDQILREEIEANGGHIFKTVGDAFYTAFSSPHCALAAALSGQHVLLAEQWPDATGPVHVRMALHTGAVDARDGDYFGQPLNRVARLLSAGYGGQVLLSEVTYGLVRDALPPGVQLRDLGEHRLKDLYRPERIFQVIASGAPWLLASDFPPLRTLDNHPNNLPEQLAPFIGREKQTGEVGDMLRRLGTRLLTLTGPGGTGKTRIALQVGAELVDEMEHGVWFVNLAPISDPSLVLSEIAQALGVTETGGRPLIESLKDYLREKQVLLILDNFEQVAKAATPIVDLLRAASRMKVLATSRVPLHVSGEQEYPIPPLDLPDRKHLPPVESLTQYEAVALFIQRAQLVKPDFLVINENAPAVAEICYRLDGLPLAIELAAARIKFFPPQSLLARLESRLKTLTGGARDVPARQQTLRNTIEWSYDLLTDDEKLLFRRLAVFVGGRSIEAAEAICSAEGEFGIDIVEGMLSLVDKSLLRQEEGEGREPRFVMLETIHEFAREKLDESGEGQVLKRRHAEYFVSFAEEVEPRLKTGEQVQWLAHLEEEHDNLRAAISWALEGKSAEDLTLALRLVGALGDFWNLRSHYTEGRARTAAALAREGAREQKLHAAKALYSTGFLALRQGYEATARTCFADSLVLYREVGDRAGISAALNGLARLEEDRVQGRRMMEEALALAQQAGVTWLIAFSFTGMGHVNRMEGNYEAARQMYSESLKLNEELGDKYNIAVQLSCLATVSFDQGDYRTARSYEEKALALNRAIGAKANTAAILANLAETEHSLGDNGAATAHNRECLILASEIGSAQYAFRSISGLGELVGEQGQLESAARLLGVANQIFRKEGLLGPTILGNDYAEHEVRVATTRAKVDEATWKRAWAEGEAMSMEEAIEYALRETEDD